MDCFVVSLLAMTKGQRVMSSFSFLFLVGVLWFMDCHRPSAFAMTKGGKRWLILLFFGFLWWFCGLWIATTSAKSRNDKGGEWWLILLFFCEWINIGGLWIASSFHSSQWQYPHTVIARLWKSRGNLSMATTLVVLGILPNTKCYQKLNSQINLVKLHYLKAFGMRLGDPTPQ